MLTYILIGCVVTILLDYIAFTMMQGKNIGLLGAGFSIVFWPLVIFFLFFFLVGELFDRIDRLSRKRK